MHYLLSKLWFQSSDPMIVTMTIVVLATTTIQWPMNNRLTMVTKSIFHSHQLFFNCSIPWTIGPWNHLLWSADGRSNVSSMALRERENGRERIVIGGKMLQQWISSSKDSLSFLFFLNWITLLLLQEFSHREWQWAAAVINLELQHTCTCWCN